MTNSYFDPNFHFDPKHVQSVHLQTIFICFYKTISSMQTTFPKFRRCSGSPIMFTQISNLMNHCLSKVCTSKFQRLRQSIVPFSTMAFVSTIYRVTFSSLVYSIALSVLIGLNSIHLLKWTTSIIIYSTQSQSLEMYETVMVIAEAKSQKGQGLPLNFLLHCSRV